MNTKVLQIAREVALGVVCVFSLITLGLAAHFTDKSRRVEDYVDIQFAHLAVAVSVFSLVTLPIMIVFDHLRTGAFTSFVVVEVAWLSVLWVLWLAAGASTGDFLSKYNTELDRVCSGIVRSFLSSSDKALCDEPGAIAAFSFLNWLILMGYTGTLAMLAIMAQQRGQSPWTSSVKKGDFLDPAPAAATPSDKAQPPLSGVPVQQPGIYSPGAIPPMQPQGSYPTSPVPSSAPGSTVYQAPQYPPVIG